MLMRFDQLLPADLLAHLQGKLGETEFEDGQATAGPDARSVKNNLQLKAGSPLAVELGDAVLRHLRSLPQVAHTLFPKKFCTPMFSLYRTGMEYGLHVDNAIMAGPAARCVRTSQ